MEGTRSRTTSARTAVSSSPVLSARPGQAVALFLRSLLYGGSLTADGNLESLVIRAGISDDLGVLSGCKPVVEIYVAQRLDWVVAIDGAQQFEAMIPSL